MIKLDCISNDFVLWAISLHLSVFASFLMNAMEYLLHKSILSWLQFKPIHGQIIRKMNFLLSHVKSYVCICVCVEIDNSQTCSFHEIEKKKC